MVPSGFPWIPISYSLQIPSYTVDDLVTGLDVYKQSTRDIHLDYAYLEKDIYAGICDDDASKKFVSIVCLMCEAVDLPEHWLAFGEKPSLIVSWMRFRNWLRFYFVVNAFRVKASINQCLYV